MSQKHPRLSAGVLAICCAFLSLAIVVLEASSASSFPPTSSSHEMTIGASQKYAASVPQQQMNKVSAATPLAPGGHGESKRLRQTREIIPLTGPVTMSEEYGYGITEGGRNRQRRMEPKIEGFSSPLVFIPSRGRRYEALDDHFEKRQLTIEQMLEKGDYFVPNRGKKAPTAGSELMIKKGKFDVLLGPGSSDEYFYPNRGKKEYSPADSVRHQSQLLPGRSGLWQFLGSGFGAAGLGGDGRYPFENRLRRNLLENLANEHKDTFFSSRGKRLPLAPNGVMLLPAKTLPVEEDEVLPDTDRSEGLPEQQLHVDSALFWSDAVPLLPLDRHAS